MKQRLLFLDFETYYDDQFNLRKMAPANYILDPRFETIMVGTKCDGVSQLIDGPDFPKFLAGFDPAVTTTVTFNSLFDNCILAWRYGFVPRRMIDVLGIARAMLSHVLPSLSLEKVAEYLGVGVKGNDLVMVKGMHRAEIIAHGLWPRFSTYCMQDVHLMEKVMDRLIPDFPSAERRVMDLVLRCAVEPAFHIDTGMLEQHVKELQEEKENLLLDAGLADRDSIMSNDGFRTALENLGVDVQMKTSPAGREIPAFAKTDDFMAELQEHEDTVVQALVAARLGHKSTIEETRSQRLLSVAGLSWPTGQPLMPIPLRYAAAHTMRLGGDWKMNMQNMPSSRSLKPSKLRKSLKAPPGHKVVVADLGQIEARLTAWLCNATKLFEQFATGLDPYASLGRDIFQVPAEEAVPKLVRFIGKSGVLGLGFGAAAPKFYAMVIRTARTLGMNITELKKVWTLELAKKSVEVYRKVNSPIPDMWRTLGFHLDNAWSGKSAPVKLGPVIIGDHCVVGPGGLVMRYDYSTVQNGRDLFYKFGARNHKIYGAKFLENIIQFLARIIIMNAALRIADRGYRFKLQAHDELAFIVPDAEVDNCKKIVHEEMTRRPSWARELPLTAEVNSGQSYGDAK